MERVLLHFPSDIFGTASELKLNQTELNWLLLAELTASFGRTDCSEYAKYV